MCNHVYKNWIPLLLLAFWIPVSQPDAQPMHPEEALGFQVGADYKVAGWTAVSDYLRHVADTSERVQLEVLGKTTEGNDFVMLLISAPENLANLAR